MQRRVERRDESKVLRHRQGVRLFRCAQDSDLLEAVPAYTTTAGHGVAKVRGSRIDETSKCYRLWRHVTAALYENDIGKASKGKHWLEQRQRLQAKQRAARHEQWRTKACAVLICLISKHFFFSSSRRLAKRGCTKHLWNCECAKSEKALQYSSFTGLHLCSGIIPSIRNSCNKIHSRSFIVIIHTFIQPLFSYTVVGSIYHELYFY